MQIKFRKTFKNEFDLKGHVINTVDNSTIFNAMLKKRTYLKNTYRSVLYMDQNLLDKRISKKLFSGEYFKYILALTDKIKHGRLNVAK